MSHSMHGADHQTPLACRSRFPSGYERVDIKIPNGFGTCHNKLTPLLLRRTVAHHKKSVIAPGSSAKISRRTVFDLHSHERWAMEGIHNGI